MATAIWFQGVSDTAAVQVAFASGTLAGVDVSACEIYVGDTDVVILGTEPVHANHSWLDGDVVCALTANTFEILAPALVEMGASWVQR